MNGFSTCAILGCVTVAPEERLFGLNNTKRLLEFTVTVEKSTGAGERARTERSPFKVSAFSASAIAQAETLRAGEWVWVTAELSNVPFEAKDGKLYDRFALKARSVERVTASAAAQQQTQQQGVTRLSNGQQGQRSYTPPQNAKQALNANEADSDIWF